MPIYTMTFFDDVKISIIEHDGQVQNVQIAYQTKNRHASTEASRMNFSENTSGYVTAIMFGCQAFQTRYGHRAKMFVGIIESYT